MSSSVPSRTPQLCIYVNTLQGEESRYLIPQKKSQPGRNSSVSCPREPGMQKRLPSYLTFSIMQHRPMNTCQKSVWTLVCWPRWIDKTTLLAIINRAVRPLGPVEYPQGLPEPSGRQAGQDDRRGEMRKGQKDSSTHSKFTLPGPWTEEWPHPYTCSSGVVEDEPQVFQWGDGQGSVCEVRHESQAAVKSADGEKVPWWYSS